MWYLGPVDTFLNLLQLRCCRPLVNRLTHLDPCRSWLVHNLLNLLHYFIRFWDGMGVLWLEGALELEAPLLKAETISSSSNTDIGKILTSRTAD